MLTLKKVLTKKRCSVRVFKMIEFITIKLIYMNLCNKMNKFMLFENINAGATLRSYCLRGE
jgi:hypothetical protein